MTALDYLGFFWLAFLAAGYVFFIVRDEIYEAAQKKLRLRQLGFISIPFLVFGLVFSSFAFDFFGLRDGAGDGVPPSDPQFGTCRDAKSAGYGPYYSGIDPEYGWYVDRDSDGIVCE